VSGQLLGGGCPRGVRKCRRMSSDTTWTVSWLVERVNASWGRSQGSQYCAVTARRGREERLAPRTKAWMAATVDTAFADVIDWLVKHRGVCLN
jgi:aromatic ring-cleaving dioxygenase